MKKIHSRLIHFALGCGVLGMHALSVPRAQGQVFPTKANSVEVQVTSYTAPNNGVNPAVKNGYVTWTRQNATTGTTDVFVYNIASQATTQITTDGTAYLQAMEGNTVVYADIGTSSKAYNIWAYDVLTKMHTQLTFDSNGIFQLDPSISGNRVVWDDSRSVNTTVFGILLTGGSEFQVSTPAGGAQHHPSISGTLVAWQDERFPTHAAVYAVNLDPITNAPGTEIAVSNTVESLSPRVDGNHIVYAKQVATSGGLPVHNIFVWNATTNTESQVSTCACDQLSPRISGNRIVWADNRNLSTTGWDLYGADLSTGQTDIAVDTEPGDQILHDIDGTNVVFSDKRTGTENVFLLKPGGRSYAYVANVLSGTVSVIDTQNNRVVAAVPVGSFPTQVAVTPDGAFAYVTTGTAGVSPPPPSTVSVFNTANNTVVATVPVVGIPVGVAITPNGAFAYVTNFGANVVSVISTATNTVVATVPVGFGPEGIAITPNGTFAYVLNEDSNSVSVINTASNTVAATVPLVASDPTEVAITPNGAFAYVTHNNGPPTSIVSVIDTTSNSVVATITVPSFPFGVAISPSGGFAYVADSSSGFVGCACNVLVINTATNAVVASVPVGVGSSAVAITPDGAFAYVTNADVGTVSVINTATNVVVATVPVGALPFGIAVGPPIAPILDFSLGSIPPLSVTVGGSGTSSVTVNSINGFTAPVTLSVSTPPAGVSSSFTPNPVTPPSGGSASSTLTVSVGPSVTPSTFTLTVTGTSGALTHSAALSVTVTADASSITNVIGELLTARCVDNSGIGNALDSKLAAAQAAISAGNIQTAINTLTAVKNQLLAQSGKHVATSCSIGGVTFNPVTVLLTDVQSLIDSLRVSLTPDPITGYVVNSSGVGIVGATVSIIDTLGNTVATATTDITGFYFFPTTGVLASGSSYTVTVTQLPSPFMTSTPASQPFTWQGAGIALGNFLLN